MELALMTDKEAFIKHMNEMKGRSDIGLEFIESKIAKLERYVAQGGEKSAKYQAQLDEARQVKNFLETE
jgi:hypothetical protein